MKTITLALAVLTATTVFAQRNYTNGLIVLPAGDTLRGEIDYKEWSISPASINFRSAAQTEPKKYEARDLKYFEVTNKESYVSAPVLISMDPVEVSEVKTIDTSFRTDHVFLKVQEDGKFVTLLSYRDALKERFYIRENGREEVTELVFRRYNDHTRLNVLVTENIFRDQLVNLLRSRGKLTPEWMQKIGNTEYQRNALKRLIAQINSDGEKKAGSSRVSKVSFFAGAGMRLNTLIYRGRLFYTQYPANESTIQPQLSGGIDIFNNRHTEKVIIRTELALTPLNFTSQGINSKNINTQNPVLAIHELKSSVLSLIPQALYNVYNSSNLKIPLGVGLSVKFATYSKNLYTEKDAGDGTVLKSVEDYFELENVYYAAHVSAGIVLKNKLEGSVIYQPRSVFTNYNGFGIGYTSLQFRVFYLFRR